MRLGPACARRACRDRRVEGNFPYKHAHWKQQNCAKTCEKTVYNEIRFVLRKKHFEKTPIISTNTGYSKETKNGQVAKEGADE